jgi:hypothetical protein
MKLRIIFIIVFCPSILFSQPLLDKIITIQETTINYKGTPYESIISFAKNKRNEIYKNFPVSFNRVDSLHIIEGYNPINGSLYGMVWLNKKGYCYFLRNGTKGKYFVKTKVIRNYLNNKYFNSQILLDVQNWNMEKNSISGVHDGLYFVAVKVVKGKDLNYEIKTKKFYEY